MAAHQEPDQLYSEIGKLKMEVDWLKKSLGSACRAVSYTHLRAHETVLDLVCRLLLEKKKEKNKKKR